MPLWAKTCLKQISQDEKAPYLNPDAFCRFIGPKNLGKVLVDDELVTCLLDNGHSSTSSCPPMLRSGEWTSCPWSIWPKRLVSHPPHQRHRWHLSGTHWVCYDECQGAWHRRVRRRPDCHSDGRSCMMEWLVILGTPTIYWVMEVIKESEISKLAVPWASLRISWLMRDVMAKLGQVMVNDIANKPIAPLHVDEVVRVAVNVQCLLLATRPFMVRSISFCMVTR